MSNSTHKVEVVRVNELKPHENADTLSIVNVHDGYTVVVRTVDWCPGALGAYVPPDSVVDTERPEFAFLKREARRFERIRVKRLRGTYSMGLLLPAPEGTVEGADVASLLGVTHYEAPEPVSMGGEDSTGPTGFHPVYDVESLRRYGAVFKPGEPVWISEKVHGINARFVFLDGQLHVGSRTRWKKENEKSVWWKAIETCPAIRDWCTANPGKTLYGEVYGRVQDLNYGIKSGVAFAAFDVLDENGRWLDPEEAYLSVSHHGVPWVPVLHGTVGGMYSALAFDLQKILALAEGPSLIEGADHVREGVVVRPLHERYDPEVGRVALKVVGNGYLSS